MIEDAPPLEQTAPRFSLRADTLAVIGFALVVVVSLFPWSRFASSGFFDAWTVHWSLLAVGAGAAGLLFSLAVRRWPLDPRVEASVYAVLGLLVATGAILHHRHPAPLTEPRFTAWLAVVGAVLALLGGAGKLRATRRSHRWSD